MDLINPKTGEAYSGLAVVKGKRYPRNTEFMTMFRDGWKYLASLDLAGRDTRVLFKLLERLDYENWISIAQETVAEELGLDRANVTRSVNRLHEVGVIERQHDPADKRRWMYRLNAELGWKGDARQWVDHMQRRAKGQKSNVIALPVGGALRERERCDSTPDLFAFDPHR